MLESAIDKEVRCESAIDKVDRINCIWALIINLEFMLYFENYQ